MTEEFVKTENTLKGKLFEIPNVRTLIDEGVYENEKENLGTENIECASADTTWEVTGVNGGSVLIKFNHKLWSVSVDGEYEGDIEYDGLLSVDILTGDTHTEIYNKA